MTKVTTPEPFTHWYDDVDKELVGCYSAIQMEAYAAAKANEALEEAASIVQANADVCRNLLVRVMLESNADAIRALIPTTK